LIPKEGKTTYNQEQTTFLKPIQFLPCATTIAMLVDSLFLNQIHIASTLDPLVFDIKQWLYCNDNTFKLMDNLLYFKKCLHIPEGPYVFKFFKLDMTFLSLDILDSTKH